MAYCTETDVKRLLNSEEVEALADDDTDGAADGTTIDDMIVGAGRKIFSYIKSHHSDLDPEDLTAGPTVPFELRDLCAELTAWYLRARQEHRDQEEWDRIIQQAKDIGDGTATIASATTRSPESTRDGVAKEFSDRTQRRYGEAPRGQLVDDLNDPFGANFADLNDNP